MSSNDRSLPIKLGLGEEDRIQGASMQSFKPTEHLITGQTLRRPKPAREGGMSDHPCIYASAVY